ncbi:MAG: hypothetical protein WC052_05210 [Patescibacteria group bacterium]
MGVGDVFKPFEFKLPPPPKKKRPAKLSKKDEMVTEILEIAASLERIAVIFATRLPQLAGAFSAAGILVGALADSMDDVMIDEQFP